MYISADHGDYEIQDWVELVTEVACMVIAQHEVEDMAIDEVEGWVEDAADDLVGRGRPTTTKQRLADYTASMLGAC